MISAYSDLIRTEASKSWLGINFEKEEPEIIKQYLLNPAIGVDYLNQNIAKKITEETNFELKFASVFCHKKPIVTRTADSIAACTGSSPGCELGDLMTVFILLDKDKKTVCSTANIMQAKKTDNLNSDSQRCLYESDLTFEMPNTVTKFSSCLTPSRTLPDYDHLRDRALSYLILNNGRPLAKDIPSSSNLNYGWDYFIQLFLELKMGLEFTTARNKHDNGWNCIVNDLLNVGSGKAPSRTVRGIGLEHLKDLFNYYYYYPEYKAEHDRPGVPIMLIICKDKERSVEKM